MGTKGIVIMMLFILYELTSIANSLKDISKSLKKESGK